MSVAAIIVAAGSGQRLGAPIPKALVELRGRPLLFWSLQSFLQHPDVDSVIVVSPSTAVDQVRALCESRALIVPGGATRQDSVRNGLAALDDSVEQVLIHDAARPFVPAEVITSVVKALSGGACAVIPVLPVTDTIKRLDEAGVVVATLDRSELWTVQTPQGFDRSVLSEAHSSAVENSIADVTDDAGLVERLGLPVRTVAGSPELAKITTGHDLSVANRMADS